MTCQQQLQYVFFYNVWFYRNFHTVPYFYLFKLNSSKRPAIWYTCSDLLCIPASFLFSSSFMDSITVLTYPAHPILFILKLRPAGLYSTVRTSASVNKSHTNCMPVVIEKVFFIDYLRSCSTQTDLTIQF